MLSLAEKMKYAYIKGEPMPLKGHTKVILADGLTGKVQEVVESDNMVTNAVADILSKNWSGVANFSSIFPLRNLYGGVMCFSNEITENANNYNPPSEAVNPMKACAGDIAHATANPYRGNPNGGETTTTDTSIKFVWDWSTNQGNGMISCVCLCPNTLGNMGLKPFDTTYNPYSVMGSAQLEYGSDWTADMQKKRPFNISANGKTSVTTAFDADNGTTFTERTLLHDYLAFGIMRGYNDWVETSSRTATIRAGYRNRIIFDDADYYYIAHATSATAMQIDKISKADMTVTTNDLTFSGISLCTETLSYDPARSGRLRVFPYDGRYLYFPNSTRTQFYKLDLTNQADPQLLNGTVNISVGSYIGANNSFCSPIVLSDGLIVGHNYVINNDTAYPIKEFSSSLANAYAANNTWLIKDGAAVYGSGKQTATSSAGSYQGAMLLKMFLSTINNLEAPITKSSSQTMKIEYTLTEA